MLTATLLAPSRRALRDTLCPWHFNDLAVTPEQFAAYLERNKDVGRNVEVVPESNELMTGSYAMVDPAGRFFDNTEGRHTYGKPILEVGMAAALKDMADSAHTLAGAPRSVRIVSRPERASTTGRAQSAGRRRPPNEAA